VLHAILDFIVDGYLPIVEAIEEEVLETEQRTLDAFLEREEIGRLFTLRRELIRFQPVLGPMHEVCNKLTHGDCHMNLVPAERESKGSALVQAAVAARQC
jgi:magnesium transporter